MTHPESDGAKLCASCKAADSVITLRHRQFCKSLLHSPSDLTTRPCAAKFILQKFKRQMGLLKEYFESLHRDTKGRLKRILVVVDSSSASEALIRMLESYFAKDDETEQRLDMRPDVDILDTTATEDSMSEGWDFKWMEYTKLDITSLQQSRIGLKFEKGRIFKTNVEVTSSENILEHFTVDSRGEARRILLSKVVSTYAENGGYDVVLQAETATRIASKVLTLTSQGRGYTVPWECGILVKMPNGNLPLYSF